MLRFDCDFGPIQKHRQMDNCIFSQGKDNLYGLLVIKLYLPLVYQDLFKLLEVISTS